MAGDISADDQAGEMAQDPNQAVQETINDETA
jgi:hypothetical protein